jgi:hypothetical protein
MGIKSALSKPFAAWSMKRLKKSSDHALEMQEYWRNQLIQKAKNTVFGKDHGFANISSYTEFKAAVPVRDYEELSPYIKRVVKGERDVVWPGIPKYFCKTSGTTSGVKYIPISQESMPEHINAARNALLSFIHEENNADFVNGKMIFLQGSPEMHQLESGIPYGRLSGIVAHHVPGYLQKNRLPSFETNCIEDWEEKVLAIVKETAHQNMTLISGIPAWVQMYYEKLLEYTGKSTVAEVFPNLSLFVYGGVNFEPYRKKFKELVGKDLPSVETYPASEGFIAFQDKQDEDGLLLNVNGGIFFEFIKAATFGEANQERVSLADVELNENYALVMNTNAGLWGYSIGDTVKFTSLNPPRIKVTGRIKHFTSAFGEHVIAEEIEAAMSAATSKSTAVVNEFHLAPQVQPESGLPYHEWLIEFDHMPEDLEAFALSLDEHLREKNPYYDDLISGNILRTAVVTPLSKGTFHAFMETQGRLGGQNKVQRLSNDRITAEGLLACAKIG